MENMEAKEDNKEKEEEKEEEKGLEGRVSQPRMVTSSRWRPHGLPPPESEGPAPPLPGL